MNEKRMEETRKQNQIELKNMELQDGQSYDFFRTSDELLDQLRESIHEEELRHLDDLRDQLQHERRRVNEEIETRQSQLKRNEKAIAEQGSKGEED